MLPETVARVGRRRSWSPTLTDRQRVLLHTHPLLLLRHHWLMREDEGSPSYDPLCLSMKLFDVVIDQSGFGSEVARDTIQEELAPLLESLDRAADIPPDRDRHARIVERLIGGLLNESQRGESFVVEYSDFDDDGVASRRVLSFKLLKEVHGYSGEITLQLSSEAINLFLNALDLDIESEQIANEAVVQFQLDRGNFDKARAGAETARGRSLQYEQKIHRVIEQTKRDIRQVDWREEVHQMLVDANEHVATRLRMEEAILRSARDNLALLDSDDAHRPSLSGVVRLIDDCRSRHLRLNKRLMSARGEFIEQQARQSFLDEWRKEPVNLRDEILAPLLALPGVAASEIADSAGHALVGPLAPRMLALRELLTWQLQPKRVQTPGESPIEEIEAVDTNVEAQRFDDEVWEGCEKVIDDLAGVTHLSSLLDELEEEGCPAAVQDAVALRILEQFDPEDDLVGTALSVDVGSVDGLQTRWCAGDDLRIGSSLERRERGK
jgi:hypothetical protein